MPDTPQRSASRSGWTGLCWAILVSAGVWSVWGALHPFSGDTANSRMASVYALAHHESWEIGNSEEENPFESGTIDKVRVDGKMYSSKPPVMPLMMTAEYMLLRGVAGVNLEEPDDRLQALKVMTLTFITLPFLLSGVAFWSLLRYFDTKPWVQAMGLLAFLWGTEYAGYAATVNNHVPATACLTIGMWGYITLEDRKGIGTGILMTLLGIVMGLAVVIDLPSAIFVLILIVGFVAKFSKVNVSCGVAGFLVPVAVHSGIMLMLTGSPLPFQMNHDYYMYEESYWRNPVGIDALNHAWGLYLFNMTFGRVGVFIMYPLFLIGAISVLKSLFERDSKNRLWCIGVVCSSLILGAYYVSSTNNYGGSSFGFRWLIITTPFFMVPACQFVNQTRSRFVVGICVVLLSISVFSATQCRLNPWSLGREWPIEIFGTLM